jgi:hypothetical protein
MAEVLGVVPTGLRAACDVLSGHSTELVASSCRPAAATEAAGVAAVALTGAFERFRTVLGQRLSCVSSALDRAAGAYTTMDDANGQAVQGL